LPSPRPASGSPGPLGSLRPGSLERSPLPSCSSPALRRHLSVFASRSPPGPLRPSSTQEPLAPGASLELLHPSAFPDKTTLLLAPLPGSAPPTVLADEESPSGFGYPLGGVKPVLPSEASLSSQHSWASPSRAFLLPDDRPRVSPKPLRPRASHENLPASARRPDGFLPSEKPCPSCPRVVTPGRNLLLSWAFSTSWALPPLKIDPGPLSPNLPSRPSLRPASQPD
jgi:hypothetical protein